MLILENARLIDGTGAPPRSAVRVTVDGDRIAGIDAVRHGSAAPPVTPNDTVIDLGGRSLMPGLVEAHVHLTPALGPDLDPYGLAQVARTKLAQGITTVRDCGAFGRELFHLRDAIARDLTAGPRLVLSALIISATSPGGGLFMGMYREADGPTDLRRAVREQVRDGADFIKVMATGALTVPGEDIGPAQLTAEELGALVDEAHRLRRRVAAHAEGLEGIQIAVEAGADTIEHGEHAWEDAALLDRMADRRTILVPTLCAFDSVSISPAYPAWMQERAKRLGEHAFRTVAAARRAGVPIAMGADTARWPGARELPRLVDAGLSPMEAIQAGTSVAAAACALEGEVGTVTVGRIADLLVVDGDPLADIGLLSMPDSIWLVVQAGVPVAGRAIRPA